MGYNWVKKQCKIPDCGKIVWNMTHNLCNKHLSRMRTGRMLPDGKLVQNCQKCGNTIDSDSYMHICRECRGKVTCTKCDTEFKQERAERICPDCKHTINVLRIYKKYHCRYCLKEIPDTGLTGRKRSYCWDDPTCILKHQEQMKTYTYKYHQNLTYGQKYYKKVKRKKEYRKKYQRILDLRSSGMTLDAVAKQFAEETNTPQVTRETVRQICKQFKEVGIEYKAVKELERLRKIYLKESDKDDQKLKKEKENLAKYTRDRQRLTDLVKYGFNKKEIGELFGIGLQGVYMKFRKVDLKYIEMIN